MKKKREIQRPIHPLLCKVQRRLFHLLNRFELPDYLFSGKKGISYISNAKLHQNSKFALKMDIEHFYANTTGEVVFQFFYHKLKMASDLAHILTNISTYRDFSTNVQSLPTGSITSHLLAFLAHLDMFESISELSKENNYIFSLYVDDMTFSSDSYIPHDFHKKIEEILQSKKLRFKRSKVRYYSDTQSKLITGITITQNNEITVPNRRLKKTSNSIARALSPSATKTEKTSALGKINSVQQVNSNLFMNPSKQLSSK